MLGDDLVLELKNSDLLLMDVHNNCITVLAADFVSVPDPFIFSSALEGSVDLLDFLANGSNICKQNRRKLRNVVTFNFQWTLKLVLKYNNCAS